MVIPENSLFMKTRLPKPEIYNKIKDYVISRDKGAQERKGKFPVKSTIPAML